MADTITVGQKAQDGLDTDTNVYTRKIVVPTRQAVHVDHEDNALAVAQEALQHGVQVTPEGFTYETEAGTPDEKSTTITYTAPGVLITDTFPGPGSMEFVVTEAEEELDPDPETGGQ